jgi:4-amino-4-deoxy-L-arabinose transferase-like glycosyltransferase
VRDGEATAKAGSERRSTALRPAFRREPPNNVESNEGRANVQSIAPTPELGTAPAGERIPRATVAGGLARFQWHRAALAGVILLAAALNLFRLNRLGYANVYYAAGVRSMLENWRNFFFVSFDPGGFVSIDKPPLGFWIQAASAKLFGFSGLSLLAPEALAGVASVALLYWLVRRVFGRVAGLLAALALALTPVSVAVARNNTIDALLILTLLAAVWAVSRASEESSLRWLLVGAALVGIGFEIKMMQAYFVAPALWLAYFLGSRRGWRVRIAHLAAATAVLLVVSLAWATAVDLTSANERPYVGSSETNSALNLALGYNGLFRLVPAQWLPAGLTASFGGVRGGETAAHAPSGAPRGMPSPRGLEPGPLRLFSQFLAGQIGWLLPLAALGGIAAWLQTRTRLPFDRRHIALTIWGGWFVTAAAFFSVATGFTLMHRYYLAMLSPPTAALVGAGLVALWRDWRRPGWRGWLLPLTVAATAALAAKILADYPDWSIRLTPIVLLFGLGAALAQVAIRVGRRRQAAFGRRVLPAVALAGLIAIFAAPTTWAGITTWDGMTGGLPAAGPSSAAGFGFGPLPGASAASSQESAAAREAMTEMMADFARGGFGLRTDPKLVAFLAAHDDGQRFLFATMDANSAAPYVIATGRGVAALGGFTGGDPIVTPAGIAAMVARGDVRYFYVPSAAPSETSGAPSATGGASDAAGNESPGGFGAFPGFSRNANVQWINAHCAPVPTAQWQTASSGSGGGEPFGRMNRLFDCKGAA